MATITKVTLAAAVRGLVPTHTDLRFYAVAECELAFEDWEVRMMTAPGEPCFELTGEVFAQRLEFERPEITPISRFVINDHAYKFPTEEKDWVGFGEMKTVMAGEFTPIELPNKDSPPAKNMVVALVAWPTLHQRQRNAVVWAEITLRSKSFLPILTSITARSNSVQLP